MEEKCKNRKRNDTLLIIGILLGMGCLALLIRFVFFQTGNRAVVTIDNVVVFEQELSVDCQIPIQTNQGYNLFQIENRVASVVEADCRDQICVEHVGISKKGETIVCLPHKLIVEIQ